MPDDGFPPMGYWVRATLTVAATFLVLAAAWTVRNILLLVLVAVVLAVGLDPQVRWFQRRRLSRAWAVTIITLLAVGFLALFAWLVIPPAIHQTQELGRSIPGYIDRLQHATGFLGTLEAKYHLAERLRDARARLPSLALGRIPGITKSAGGVIVNLLTVAVLTIYFLMGLARGKETAKSLVAGQHAERNARIVDESLERIGGYVSGNLLVGFVAAMLVGALVALITSPRAFLALGVFAVMATGSAIGILRMGK